MCLPTPIFVVGLRNSYLYFLLQSETINRLLKKQSRPQAKNKRITATAATSHADTPAQASSAGDGDGDAEEDEEEEEIKHDPVMYRWVSNKSGLSFSLPVAAVTVSEEAGAMDVDSAVKKIEEKREISKAFCDVRGCGEVRKYRLVRDWERGACGMIHLKVLEGKA